MIIQIDSTMKIQYIQIDNTRKLKDEWVKQVCIVYLRWQLKNIKRNACLLF